VWIGSVATDEMAFILRIVVIVSGRLDFDEQGRGVDDGFKLSEDLK
jgi:hypothetical protein